MKKSVAPKVLQERGKVQIYAPKELLKEARIQAVIEGTSLSTLITEAISQYMNRHAKP